MNKSDTHQMFALLWSICSAVSSYLFFQIAFGVIAFGYWTLVLFAMKEENKVQQEEVSSVIDVKWNNGEKMQIDPEKL